jgi:hypothetical protein
MKIVEYIINDLGVHTLFKTDILHSDMATNAFSAGYAIISYDLVKDTFGVKCYGESESLKINTNRNNCLIIQNYLNKVVGHSDRNEFDDYKLDSLLFDSEL